MKIKLGVMLALLLAATSPVHAAKVWFKNVLVKDVFAYTEDGYNTMIVLFDPASATAVPNTNCAPTQEHNILGWWTTGAVTTNAEMWFAVLLSAQAQGLPVDLMVEDSSCSLGASFDDFGAPYGLGSLLQGVRIRGQ